MIRLDDALVEAHHALIDVHPDGQTRFVQLTGRVPIDGEALVIGTSRVRLRRRDADHPADEPSRVHDGCIARSQIDPWRRELRRGPAPPIPPADDPIVLPEPPSDVVFPPATGMIGAAFGVAGAVVMARVLGQMLFAAFALVGGLASFTTWAVGAVSAWRRRRRSAAAARDDHDRLVTALATRRRASRARHLERHPDIVRTLYTLRTLLECPLGAGTRTWSRRGTDGLCVVIGHGTYLDAQAADLAGQAIPPPALQAALDAHGRWNDVPIPIELVPGETLAVRGDTRMVAALLRSFVVQFATWVGPADLRIAVVTVDPPDWEWVGWLPHARDRVNDPMVFASTALDGLVEACESVGARRLVLVVDDPSLLSIRTSPLRRLMAVTQATTLVAVDPASTVPVVCSRTLVIGSLGSAEWIGSHDAGRSITDVRVAGIDRSTAMESALSLAPLVDPEDTDQGPGRLPTDVTMADVDPELVVGSGRSAVLARWHAGGADPALRVALGVSDDGDVEIDLVGDGPHALVAGTTGSGKSELLRTLIVGLAGRLGPEHVTFVLVDYKGGATFDRCADLPHTLGVVTDLDDGLAARVIVGLDAELARRERSLRAVDAADLAQYRLRDGVEPIPRLVVVVDEFATLARELPDVMTALVGIAQRGRSLGLHLVLATQRPGGVVSDDIRANTNLRIALRVNDRAEASDVVGTDRPSAFPRGSAGRAVVRLGADEVIEFQSARCTGPARSTRAPVSAAEVRQTGTETGPDARPVDPPDERTELEVAVAEIRAAAARCGEVAPLRPWADPLPDVLDHDRVTEVVSVERVARGCDVVDLSAPHDAVGVIDDPAAQCHRPLRWDPADGNLVAVGSLGAGLTSTLLALVAALCRTGRPDEIHVYVVDAAGDGSTALLASRAHCGAVIRVGEYERVHRLLARLGAEIDRRAANPVRRGTPRIVLFVDGLPELRRALEPIERLATLALLDRVLDAGPSVGIACCVTTDGSSPGAHVPAADRWFFRVDGDVRAGTGSRPGASIPPGRLRQGSSGLAGQVAAGARELLDSLPLRSSGVGPAEVAVLPPRIDPSDLPVSTVEHTTTRSIRRLVVGCAADDLGPAVIDLPDGDHLFVGGAARTGRSTALDRLTAAWEEVEGPQSVIRWGCGPVPERWLDRAAEASTGVLVVVDDGERVPDSDGSLTAIARGHHPTVTLAVAARLDAVRAAYGHWTREVTRSRCGLVMTSPGELDGDLLGVVLPRRTLIAPRPGLAWLVDGHGHRLVQVADRMRS